MLSFSVSVLLVRAGLELRWCAILALTWPNRHFFSEKYHTGVSQGQHRSQHIPDYLNSSEITLSQEACFQPRMQQKPFVSPALPDPLGELIVLPKPSSWICVRWYVILTVLWPTWNHAATFVWEIPYRYVAGPTQVTIHTWLFEFFCNDAIVVNLFSTKNATKTVFSRTLPRPSWEAYSASQTL